MRVLLTSPFFPPLNSGLANAVHQQATTLLALGHEVVVATGGDSRKSRKDEFTGIPVEEFSITGSRYFLHPVRGEVASYIEFLEKSRFDIVIMNAWQNWATDLVLENYLNIPGKKYLYSHCISTNLYFKHQPIRSLIRYLAWRPYWRTLPAKLSKIDGMIVLADKGESSRFGDIEIARKCGVPLFVIPNTLSPAALEELRRPLLGIGQRTQIIAVGAYQWQKGFDFVLEAYAKTGFKNRLPLKFFGTNFTTYTPELQKLASKLGIGSEYITFLEGVSDHALMQEYRNSILFLSGSHTECQPLVLLDANAAGTPFISRASGCIPSMPGGVVVNTIDEMAGQIDKLAAFGGPWLKLSHAGRVAAAEKHHPGRTARLFQDVLARASKLDDATGVNRARQ